MDVTYCAKEADYALQHFADWMEPQRAPMPLVFQPGHIRVRRDPLGVTLIIGAWNEPFMLTFGPLTAALAGGNTAVLKPSEVAANCAAAAARLAPKYFDPRAVAVVEGAVPETTALLEQQWDFIFFTGSPSVGKIVHQAAAKHLTPCVLELGGKNPTIVHSSANLKVAARRIAYGRLSNSGHICTAPDHVLVWPKVKEEFVRHLSETNDRPSSLGLYVFAEDSDVVERILDATSSGDAEVNDCAIHPLFPELPFGGVGNSGMGKYHGHWGFEAFTNARGVLYHSAKLDPGVRYPPYTKHTLQRAITSKLMP